MKLGGTSGSTAPVFDKPDQLEKTRDGLLQREQIIAVYSSRSG